MSRYKVRKKTYYDILENIRGIKEWMFFDYDITEIEILNPTIENLSLMREYNFTFVVKGFLYPGEFSYLNHIRYRYGLAKIMFLSRSVSTDIMVQAIESLAGQGHLPTKKEIDEDKERNRLVEVTDKEQKKIIERNKYKKEMGRYFVLLNKAFSKLYKRGRVELLEVLV